MRPSNWALPAELSAPGAALAIQKKARGLTTTPKASVHCGPLDSIAVARIQPASR